MKVTETIQAALAKATFSSPDIKPALEHLLTTHKEDLGDVGYEPSTNTEAAIKSLNATLDAVDEEAAERKETLRESVKLAREEDDR